MPRILENDAASVVQNIGSLPEDQRLQALDVLKRYKEQQDDLGEPQWPSQAQTARDAKERVAGMFTGGIDKVPFEVSPWSKDPAADKATVANMSFLAHRYGKTPQEIADRPDFYRNDYARKFFGQPGGVDEKTFYGLAAKQIQGEQQQESATLDGVKAALRGDDVIPALQSWQLKNGLERMPDSTQFTMGFLNTRAKAGDHLDFADTLLKQIESNVGMTKGDGAERPAPASQEMAGQFEQSLTALADMKPRDRKQVYAIIGAKAEAAGYDQKGFWAQMLGYAGKQMARIGDTTTTAAADLVSSGAVAGDGIEGGAVTPDTMTRFQSGVDTRGKRGVIYDELSDIVARDVDPVKPVIGWLNDSVETGLIKAPGSVAPFMMASAALGPLGGGVLFTADFAEQNRRDLVRSGLDDSDARLIGMAAAPVQAAVESLSNGLQLGRFPAVQKALAGLTKPIGGGAGMATRYVLNSAISVGSEYTEEQLQDNVIRPAIQNIAAAFDQDVPEIGIGQIWDNIKQSTPELLFTLAPMALVFGGTMTAAQAKLSSATVSSQDMLEAAGFSAAQANSVRAEASPEAQISKARELWGSRAGTAKTMEDAAKSVAERMRLLQTDHIAAQQDLEQRGILPRMLRATDDKWRLTFNDGSTADFNSHQEADAARWQWSSDQLGKVHTAVQRTLGQMEKGADVGREFALQFSPDERHATPDEMASKDFQDRVKQGELLDEVRPEQQYSDAVAIDKASGGDVVQKILGSSVNTFKDGVLTTTMRLYHGADITTLVEEKLEGDAKAIMADADGRQWMLDHMRNYEQASGDKLFTVESDAQVTDKMLAEAWSHLGQSYLVGKSTDAKAWQGKTARRLFNYVLNAGLSPVMNAETQYWRAVAIRAQRVVALQKEGKLGNDLAATLEKQLGIDSQAKHEAGAAKEAQAIYSEANPGPNGETFSLMPSFNLALTQQGEYGGDAFKNADGRYKHPVYLKDGRRLSGETFDYNTKTGGMPTFTAYTKSGALITLQAQYVKPDMIASSRDGNKSADDLRDRLTKWEQGQNNETLSIRPGDFSSRMAAAFSPFQSSPELRMQLGVVAKSRVQKEEIKLAEIIAKKDAAEQWKKTIEEQSAKDGAQLLRDYEDAADELRKEREFELKGVTQDKGSELDRERIRREFDNKLKTLRVKYERDLNDIDAKKATEFSKNKSKSVGLEKQTLLTMLRTLDGILSAAPPEVRARVGGYVKLAGLATDEAMLKEIERRIEKLNVELEKGLKKEGITQIEKLLKKGRPTMDSGKKGKGKDADLHYLFAAAEKASKMDAVAVAGELARLDALIAGDTLTDEQEVTATTERGLVELLGDLKNADSGRVFSAIDTLKSIYDGAWLKWKLAEIERKEKRAGMRHDFITDTGKSGVLPERQAAEKAAVTMLGKIKGGFLSLSSFHEVLSYAFGSKSVRVKSLVDAEREAAGQYEDVNQALADEIEKLFTDMAGGTLDGERLRFDMAQPSIKTGKGEFSQLQAIQALLMWRQEDGRRHMEGQLDESGKPSGKWNYDQSWIDEITKAQTPEAKILMSWIMQKYGAEWATLNPLYRERYGVNMPAHDNYAPITVTPAQTKAGEVVDPVTGAAMSSGSILTPGSLRTRSRNAVAEPEFRDALQTLLVHTRQLEYWKAYYDLAVEANAILGNREVLNAVKAKGGDQAATALRKWVDAIAQGGFRDASASLEINKMMGRMTGRAATVGLLGRVSTLLVQSTQLAAASVKMPLGAYLRGMSKLLTGNLDYSDAIKSPFIQRRFKSAPPIVRQAMESLGAASKPNQITRAARGLGQLLSGADALFTAGTYALLLDYHRGTGRALGLTGAELDEHAHTEAERDTEQVAQPTRMAARSLMEITSTTPLAKVTWAYSSEARQKIALFAWSAFKAKSEPAAFAKTAFLVFGIGGLMTQVLKNLWKEAKGDDDEKKWSPERLAMDMLSSPLHGVPFFGSLMNDGNMLSGFGRLKNLDFQGDPVDIMRDVDTALSVMGMFNDAASGVAALSHLGLDAAKVLENLAEK